MEAWFVSDIHLKSQNERNGQSLLRFLRSILSGERKANYLFLLGDIFDLWVGDHQAFAQQYSGIVDTLKQIALTSTKIIYVEGNHDLHIVEFWKRYGIDVIVDPKHFDLDGYRVRIEHGDLINPNDKTYEKYRNFVRSPIMQKVAEIVPGEIWQGLGNFLSQQSRKKSSVRREQNQEEFRAMIRVYSEKVYDQEMHFDLIVTGHMHIQDEYHFHRRGQKITSINLGSWFEEPTALHLQKTQDGVVLETHVIA